MNTKDIINIIAASLFEVSMLIYNIPDRLKLIGKEDEIKKIRNSEPYQECIKIYNEYIQDIAELFNALDIKGSLQIACFFQEVLKRGYFSANETHKYKIFKHDLDFLPELWGSRVATSFSVCRHNAVMLTDLLNKMGYTACNLLVRRIDSPLEAKIRLNFNHLVTGIVDDGKYIYDPTAQECACFKSTSITKLEIDSNCIAKIITKYNDNCYKVCKNNEWVNPKTMVELKKFEEAQSKEISTSSAWDIINIERDNKKKYDNELFKFYYYNSERLEGMKALNEILAPHYDSKRKSLKK